MLLTPPLLATSSCGVYGAGRMFCRITAARVVVRSAIAAAPRPAWAEVSQASHGARQAPELPWWQSDQPREVPPALHMARLT